MPGSTIVLSITGVFDSLRQRKGNLLFRIKSLTMTESQPVTPFIPPAPLRGASSRRNSPIRPPVVPPFSPPQSAPPNMVPNYPQFNQPPPNAYLSPYPGTPFIPNTPMAPPNSYYLPNVHLPEHPPASQPATPGHPPGQGPAQGYSSDWTGFPPPPGTGTPWPPNPVPMPHTSPWPPQPPPVHPAYTGYSNYHQPLPGGYPMQPPHYPGQWGGVPPGAGPFNTPGPAYGMPLHPPPPPPGWHSNAPPPGWGYPVPPQAPPPPRVARLDRGDKIDRFAAGSHYGPVLEPLLVKIVNAEISVNPLLKPLSDAEAERVHLKWNMLFSSSTCQRSDDLRRSWMKGRKEPATFPRVSRLRLISRTLPWLIDIVASDAGVGITCGDLVDQLSRYLNQLVGGSYYNRLPAEQKEAIRTTYHFNRSTADGVPGGRLGEGIKRLEWLGTCSLFGGVDRNDALVKELCGRLRLTRRGKQQGGRGEGRGRGVQLGEVQYNWEKSASDLFVQGVSCCLLSCAVQALLLTYAVTFSFTHRVHLTFEVPLTQFKLRKLQMLCKYGVRPGPSDYDLPTQSIPVAATHLWAIPMSAGPSRLRIAFIHPDLGIGGAERLVVDAALGLQKLGHSVDIYTSYHNPSHCFEETRDGTLRVHHISPPFPRSVNGKFHILLAHARQLHLTQHLVRPDAPSYDVYFVDQLSTCVPFIRLFAQRRVVFYCHFPDKLLANGEFVEGKVRMRGGLLKGMYRLPMDWLEEVTTLSFRRDRPTFLSLNRFEKKKNVALAVHSYALLKKQSSASGPSEKLQASRLVLAGGYDPRLENNIMTLVALIDLAKANSLTFNVVVPSTSSITIPPFNCTKYNPDILFLLNFTTSQRTALLNAKSTIALLYTPTNEHFGIGPVEGMSCGLPVLACNTGGPTESVLEKPREERTGWLRPPDAEVWASALAEIVGMSERERAALGERARLRARELFGMDAMAKALEAKFEDAAAMGPISTLPIWIFISLFVLFLSAAIALVYRSLA
ncbi:hypothetical protein EW146_g2937 [Bondarzewia mesenterica]|uniref:Asparagine-linked glycosylation protein 2 n=1 Tax=Bondarzewia mesenterica TaxID=1095465 RepID=A0A4S4LZ64_9AGAM|nr:hypothetical protein EW146_g2937 [Bondarzewia mesenterica]